MQIEMSMREAILVRDAIRFFNEDQLGKAQNLPDESMRALTEQFASEREEVALRIEKVLSK